MVSLDDISNGASSPESYKILDQPHSTRSRWRILGVGAGASGLYLAYVCQNRMKDYELMIYEKNADIGGTWLESEYRLPTCLEFSLTIISDRYPGRRHEV